MTNPLSRRHLLGLSAMVLASASLTRLALAQGKTVTHEMGTTTMPDAPQRVIGLYSTDVDNALVLGLPLVGAGTARGSEGQDFPEYQKAYGLDGVTPLAIFPQTNFELIASLRPDLIVASFLRDENGYALLSAIAPTIWLPGTGWKDDLNFLADALDKQDVADNFIAGFDERVAALKAALPPTQKLAFISRMDGGTFRIVQSNRMPIFYQDLGFERSAETPETFEGEQHYSLERLDVLADADVILAMATPADSGPGRLDGEYDDMFAAPGWDELPAVRNGTMHLINSELTYASPLVAIEVLNYVETTLV